MTDLRADEERIEFGKDSEHLVRITRGPKSVPEARDDLVLDPRDMLIVRVLRGDPDFAPICPRS